jgi:hypothetical protein
MLPTDPRNEGIDWRGSIAVFLACWVFLALILLRDAGVL